MNKFVFSLKDEMIDGYFVGSSMKKVWLTQLKMLAKFSEVCDKYQLKWFASGGTLLGAVRHKGYIPWDDDIDIHMLAEDYEKFSKIAPQEMQPYFWQDWKTEPGYGPKHGKIRDSETTGATQWERLYWPSNMNKGIFIDIFPLYYIPENLFKRKWQLFRLKFYRRMVWIFNCSFWMKHNQNSCKLSFVENIEKFFLGIFGGFNRVRFIKRYLCICQCQKSPTKYIGATSFNYAEKRFIWPAYNYREMVDFPFMGGTIKVPVEWDACLRQQYGQNYMIPMKGASMHSDILFDVDVPYTKKLQ